MDPTLMGNPLQRDSLSAPNTIGGGKVHLDENGELIGATPNGSGMHDNDLQLEFKDPVNVCGCTKFIMHICIGVASFFLILFIALAFGLGSQACFAFAVISLIVLIVFLIIYCCPCCQPAKGIDD
jgi:hypothetical protein